MKAFWTRRAARCLEAIHAEIAGEQPAAANRIKEEIIRTAEMLAMWPYAGRELPQRQQVRYFPVPSTKYILLYDVELTQVSILLVVHGSTN